MTGTGKGNVAAKTGIILSLELRQSGLNVNSKPGFFDNSELE